MGVSLGSVLDDEEPVAGTCSIFGDNNVARDIAWQSLDVQQTARMPDPAKWVKVFETKESIALTRQRRMD